MEPYSPSRNSVRRMSPGAWATYTSPPRSSTSTTLQSTVSTSSTLGAGICAYGTDLTRRICTTRTPIYALSAAKLPKTPQAHRRSLPWCP